MRKTRNGIHISIVSKYLEYWEDFMPNDITGKDIKEWEEQHKEALGEVPSFMSKLIPIDLTYPSCYFSSRCRQSRLLTDAQIEERTFNFGRRAIGNFQSQWEFVMNELNKLKQ